MRKTGASWDPQRILVRTSRAQHNAAVMQKGPRAADGFTLLELMVVILVMATLVALAFPVFQGVLDRARKLQAKNDLTQLVTAINAFYTEYGRYPLAAALQGADQSFVTDNSDVINALRAVALGANASDALNPRKVVFFSAPDVKDPANPRGGVTAGGTYYDPWGRDITLPESGVYHIRVDGNYDNSVANAYIDGSAGGDPNNSYALRQGVIAWTLGKDKKLGTNGNSSFTGSDDLLSWQ